MTDDKPKKVLSLGNKKPTLELKKKSVGGEANGKGGSVRQSFSHGRSKTVEVEVKRPKRVIRTSQGSDTKSSGMTAYRADDLAAATRRPAAKKVSTAISDTASMGGLTQGERESRMRALRGAVLENEQRKQEEEIKAQEVVQVESKKGTSEEEGLSERERLRRRELEELQMIRDQERAEEEVRKKEEEKRASALAAKTSAVTSAVTSAASRRGQGAERATVVEQVNEAHVGRGNYRRGAGVDNDDGGDGQRQRRGAGARRGSGQERRRGGKMTLSKALEGEEVVRHRSMASMRRRIEREKRQAMEPKEQVKVTREVVVPEVITVQELANRMAERGADVVKALMKLGMMVTITQSIDADTAELVIAEFGHRIKRVSDSDVEEGLSVIEDSEDNMIPRPPVVTVMGHVDHGKTSLLDALRSTDVVAGEAGGITQHIGAYQIMLKEEAHGFDRITFIDTPGHAAFTEMRARGANITDVVILVVAADDGIMPQTIEAIKHAKAAKAPIVVAINKCDVEGANPDRVRQELLQHDVQVEEMGGDVLAVEISAKKRMNLDKLKDAVLLQAEMMELKANPDRPGEGAVVEAKLERGRGSVATLLIRRGTIKIGDVFVAGSEWGKVRALIDDRGRNLQEASPATPVEVLGLNGTPTAGDELMVVPSEARAREVADFRARRRRELAAAATKRTTLEQMMEHIKEGEAKELPVLIKGDVHGSVEAIKTALEKLSEDNAEVKVSVLDAAVGPITESDITLANASKGMVVGFNVRANPQARELAKRDNVEIRYYSIIYDVIDDVKQALTGMLAPELREKFLGNALIQQVFTITKVGKVAGCKITEGMVKRGAKVRLLRDNVVIHEGALKTLKRMKDEVKEVREGYECGMAFENYDDIKDGDIIECFEIEEVARKL